MAHWYTSNFWKLKQPRACCTQVRHCCGHVAVAVAAHVNVNAHLNVNVC